ncbi:MAG: gamma-glutamyltransferase [Acidobacteria bacterium]|nr:gamma-glutamyltransferase [Acidobacteriota bacterium]
MTRRLLSTLALMALVTQAPHAQTSSWRPTVMGTQGMVAAGHPLAAEVGMRVLKAGGNAVDAAIAAWAIQGQVEPGMTGLGSDLFALIYLAKTKEVKFINGSGFAPQAATIDYYDSHGGMPDDSGLSIAVPGSVSGAALALQKYGTRSMAEVLAPAIEIAENGYPITEGLARGLEGAKAKLGKHPGSVKIWLRDGKPLQMGDVVKNPDLATTLRAIAAQGAAGFYTGPVAKALVAGMQAHGAIITEADLAAMQAFEDAPISVNYRGYDVYECPPNSQGFTMLYALNLLEGFNLRYMGRNSAAYLHVVTESIKLAFADRDKYVADPKFTPNIPMREMLSKEYAATRRALIDPTRAIAGEAPFGDPRGGTASSGRQQASYAAPLAVPGHVNPYDPDQELNLTTYLTVVDKDHNMVSLTSSLLSGFGSGLVPDGTGVLMNDRMKYFYLDPNDVNSLQPMKRVRQTINPAMALKDGMPVVSFGTPGADTQPQTQLQFFLNFIEFGMTVQQALEQPTVISNSFRSSYYPHAVEGMLLTPMMLPAHVKEGLAALGHKLDLRDVRGVGSVKAIAVHPKTGVLMGGVSPTGDSYVMGW